MSSIDAMQDLVEDIKLLLGAGKIRVELTTEQLFYCCKEAIEKYRQRSENATEETFQFLKLAVDKNEYILGDEVLEVSALYRRGVGGSVAGGVLDPFSASMINSYLIGLTSSGGAGGTGLATYDLQMQNQELIGRMFGRDLDFVFNSSTKKLVIIRRIVSQETILMRVHLQKNNETLLRDVYAKPWIRGWAVARAKFILSNIRGKYQNMTGPTGSNTLDADALRQQATEEMQKLEEDLINSREGNGFYGFKIG